MGSFDFGSALKLLKIGHRVARTGWNGKDMFVFLVPGSTFTVNRPPLLGIHPAGAVINYQPHIDMRTADGTIVPWLASQTDLLAEDWVLAAARHGADGAPLPSAYNPRCEYCGTAHVSYIPTEPCSSLVSFPI